MIYDIITLWELKKYNWYNCRATIWNDNNNLTDVEWEIYVDWNNIYMLHNNSECQWLWPTKFRWYKYSRWIYFLSYVWDDYSNNEQYTKIEIYNNIWHKVNPKQTLINLIAKDNRIRNYNSNPTPENKDKVLLAYEEAIKEFCKIYDTIPWEKN